MRGKCLGLGFERKEQVFWSISQGTLNRGCVRIRIRIHCTVFFKYAVGITKKTLL